MISSSCLLRHGGSRISGKFPIITKRLLLLSGSRSSSSSSADDAAGHQPRDETTTTTTTTHFGFQTVPVDQKAGKVQDVFSSVASKYDLMNDVMSFGIHRVWKDHFVGKLNPVPGLSYLDVCGGTGDIAFRILHHLSHQEMMLSSLDRGDGGEGGESYTSNQKDGDNNSSKTSITICDVNQQMLTEGEKRWIEMNKDNSEIGNKTQADVKFVHGDAMSLPFPSNSFDAYTIAFGIRNVVSIQTCLQEAYRVMKPGGIFTCLEFSRVQNPIFEQVYDWYSFNMIPMQGEIFAGDWKSYQYLVESIRKFPDQEDFKDMIIDAGFHLVHYENLTNGIACIHTGYKKET